MTMQLLFLILLLVLAVTTATWSVVYSRPRATVLQRIAGYDMGATSALLPGATWPARAGAWLSRFATGWMVTARQQRLLIYAGHSSVSARGWFAAIRVVLLVVAIGGMWLVVGDASLLIQVLGLAAGAAVGILAPLAWLSHVASERQRRVRNSMPDSLDLLLVCVEAGVSLDAAILRVGRELAVVHPELAEELLLLNRRQNAGLSREDALRGLFERTGVEELRTLATNINQSERWGTSMSRVLRVTSESLRRARRERAEKAAALASTRMVFPLALLILPALLAAIYGPAFLNLRQVFNVLPH